MKYCPTCDQRMTLMSRDPEVWLCRQGCKPVASKPAPKKKAAPRKKAKKAD